jgi:hypothetical protein
MALLETIKKQTRISDYLLNIEYVCKRAKNQENSSIGMIEKTLERTVHVDENHSSLLVAASALELTEAYIGSTWASSPLGAGAMEIPLLQCGLDDETLHNVLEVLSESAPAPLYDVIQAQSSSSSSPLPSQDFSLKLDHQRISEGTYLSRIISLTLKGNCLTDLSCEVTYIVRTVYVHSNHCNSARLPFFLLLVTCSLILSQSLSLFLFLLSFSLFFTLFSLFFFSLFFLSLSQTLMYTCFYLKTLSALVERSAYLRTLDLRDNVITLKGVKILLAAIEHNPR